MQKGKSEMAKKGARTIRDRGDAERREKAENGTVKKRNARAREIVTITLERSDSSVLERKRPRGVRCRLVDGGREQRETKQDRTRRSDSAYGYEVWRAESKLNREQARVVDRRDSPRRSSFAWTRSLDSTRRRRAFQNHSRSAVC